MLVVHRSNGRRGFYRGGDGRAGAQVEGAAAPSLSPFWLKLSTLHLASWLSMKKWCAGGFGGGKEKMVEVSGSG
jgi:hypothetical protein